MYRGGNQFKMNVMIPYGWWDFYGYDLKDMVSLKQVKYMEERHWLTQALRIKQIEFSSNFFFFFMCCIPSQCSSRHCFFTFYPSQSMFCDPFTKAHLESYIIFPSVCAVSVNFSKPSFFIGHPRNFNRLFLILCACPFSSLLSFKTFSSLTFPVYGMLSILL